MHLHAHFEGNKTVFESNKSTEVMALQSYEWSSISLLDFKSGPSLPTLLWWVEPIHCLPTGLHT
jgi:hypothetical protein